MEKITLQASSIMIKPKLYILFLFLLIVLCPITTWGQRESSNVRQGNKEYKKENYTEAEVAYRRGLEKNKESFEAYFNLGNTLFKQGKYPEAIEAYKMAERCTKDKQKQASIEHNIGNAYYAQQQFGEAVEAYKHSLKNNPKDNDTRYNLVKAMQMLQTQQQEQSNNNQEQEQQKDNQQEQQEQQKQQEQQEQPQQQSEQQQMDKETAEQILQALEQDEQETQEKAQRQQSQGSKRVEKDW